MPSPRLYRLSSGEKLVFEDLDPDSWPYYISLEDKKLKTFPEKYKDNRGRVRVRIWAKIPNAEFNRQSIFIHDRTGSRRVGTAISLD